MFLSLVGYHKNITPKIIILIFLVFVSFFFFFLIKFVSCLSNEYTSIHAVSDTDVHAYWKQFLVLEPAFKSFYLFIF